jgi:uncharacterized protein YdgA (DUF945 family)
LTSSLLLTSPAFAQEAAMPARQEQVATTPTEAPPASAAPEAPLTPEQARKKMVDSPIFKAYLGVVSDLRPFFSQPSKLKGTLENVDQFSFSPETKKHLKTLFGNDNPLHFTKSVQPDGSTAIGVLLDGLDYKDEKGDAIGHTETGTATMSFNREFNRMRTSGNFGGLRFGDRDMRVEVGNVSIAGDNVLAPIDFWLGKSEAKIDAVTVSVPKNEFTLKMSEFDIAADVSMRKNLFDIAYDYKIGAINWGSDKVEQFDANIALTNLDGKALREFLDYSRKVDPASAGEASQMDAMMKIFKRLGMELSKHGGAIEIHNFSAQYHGQTADMKGRIAIPNLKETDFDVPQKVYEKLVVKAKLRVPMAMIDDVAHRIAKSIMEAQSKQNGAQVTDMAVDLVARGMVGKMTDTLVKTQKWAHMEKDVLVTVFEIRKGKLYFDNHIVSPQSNPFMQMARGK